MPLPTTLYCTDEDLAIRAGADFAELAPGDQALAAGNDGAFLAGDPWTLASPTAAFLAQGVLPGMIAVVAMPSPGAMPGAQHLVVDSVAFAGVTLRRKGLPSRTGQPPAPAGGEDGVQFTVATLATQIARATYDLNHRLGIDDATPGRRVSDLADATQLLEPCVLTVLSRQYHAIATRGNPEAKAAEGEAASRAASFWAKARAAKAELDDLLDRLALRWVPAATFGPADRPTTRFGMRITR